GIDAWATAAWDHTRGRRGERTGRLGARAARSARQRAGCRPGVRRARDLRAGEAERWLPVGTSARARRSGSADARDRRVGRRRLVRALAHEPRPRGARRPARVAARGPAGGRPDRLRGRAAARALSYRVALGTGGAGTDAR